MHRGKPFPLLNLLMLAMGESSGKGLRHELEFTDAEGNTMPVLVGVVYLADLKQKMPVIHCHSHC